MFRCLIGRRLKQKYFKRLFNGTKLLTVMALIISSFFLMESVRAQDNDNSTSTGQVSKATSTAWIGETGFATINDAVTSALSGENTVIELSEDQILTEQILINGGEKITVIPKGKDIRIERGAGLNTQMIVVSNASSLNLGQDKMSHEMIIHGGGKSLLNQKSPAIEINTLGTVSMYDGVTVQENASEKGAVLANNGNFFMYGGDIVNNADPTSNKMNGGVRVEGNNSNCQFVMYGGTISDNIGSGVVVNSDGGFLMENGSITRNVANNGGGVFVGTRFVMNGGEISHNQSTSLVNTNDDSAGGGGVRVHTSTSKKEYFEMNGGKIIKNTSAAHGGGIHISGEVFLKGGEISSNSAITHGGGVYKSKVNAQLLLTISGTSINHNEAEDSGGGIYSNGLLNISKTVIKENKAGNLGGGIFVDYKTETSFLDGEVVGNKAPGAGGIYNYGNLIIKGGRIVDNVATSGNGGGIISNGVDTKLYLSGSPIINDNITKALGEGIYLGETKVLIEDSMSGQADVRLASKEGQLDNVIVEAKSGYTLKNSDLSCFSYDQESFWVDMSNSQGVLKDTIQSFASSIKASSITFGDTLSNSKITATVLDKDGNSISGIWEFADKTEKPNTTGEFDIIFIPSHKKYQSYKSNVRVIVLPKNGNYTVQHYQQNITGNDYQLEDSEIVEGVVLENVFAKAKEYTGFYENTTSSLRVSSGVVADDGSLVLKLYYDRNTYTVSFQSNGGTNIHSLLNIRYGNKIELPSNPVKEGYFFGGWYRDGEFREEWKNGSFILADTTLYSKWIKKIDTLPPTTDVDTPPSSDSNQGVQNGGQGVETNDQENSLMVILLMLSSLVLFALFYQKKCQDD